MAEQPTGIKVNPISRILQVLKLEKKEITAVYFYAILSGLVQLSLPLGIQSIISFVLGGSISTSLVILIILVVLGVMFNGFVSVNQMRLIEKVQQKLFVRYSFEYANRIPKLDLQSVDSYYLPELVNRFFDTISLQKSISKLLLEIPTASIQILFGTLLLSFYHPVFIVFSVVLIALVSIILYFTSPRGMATSIEESNYKYKVAGWLEELARVVRSFKFSKGTKLNLRKTDELVGGYLNARTAHFKVLLFQYWTLIGFKMLITAAMLIVGSILLINQQLNLGQFIASEIVILLVLNSVEKLITHLDKVYDVLTSVEKLSKVIDQPVDQEGKMELTEKAAGVSVKVQGMNFKYDKRPVLKNINFNIEPGQKVAVIGEDGSGRSSLLRVLSGAYRNYEGGILLDNVPLKNYHSDSVRKNTGILLSLQDIFNGTILENITMGNSDISPNAIMSLSEKIGLKNFLEEQHDGFDTMLDPVGKRLSRNIIQKILLLRALVNDPRLLLLEEPWSNLDENHRKSIQDYLLAHKSCTILIATTSDDEFVSKCDKVLYLKNGELVNAGSWDEGREKFVIAMAIDFINREMESQFEKLELNSYEKIYRIRKTSNVKRWVISFIAALLVILFLPWTQNIRARGSVTTLRQDQRPQLFPTIIPGRVVKWHVREGDYVKKGDTLVQIGEIKDDYLDPQLLKRTQEQLEAKRSANESYQGKVKATGDQISALLDARDLKLSELDNKVNQQMMKIRSDSADLVAAINDLNIKQEQFKRQKVMYDSGLVSLTQLEQRNQALQEASAKKMSAEIKLGNARQELLRLKIERNGEMQQYAEKVSKAEGDRFQSISQIQTGQGEIAKLENQYMNYNIRSGLYTLIAPQDGQVVQAKKAGIGEILKEGDAIVEIVPTNVEYAVELFVRPVDLPLVAKGQKVMFLFDGFPAIVFSGWPNASYGIFAGEVAAVESSVANNGKFRILVKEKPGGKSPGRVSS